MVIPTTSPSLLGSLLPEVLSFSLLKETACPYRSFSAVTPERCILQFASNLDGEKNGDVNLRHMESKMDSFYTDLSYNCSLLNTGLKSGLMSIDVFKSKGVVTKSQRDLSVCGCEDG